MAGHKLKYVRFYGREVPVVLQNENGPCPMLAIANVLLLRNAIHLPANTYEVEQEKLMDILAEYLLDNNPVEPSSQYAANFQQNLQDVICNMHKLTTGVDVNPKFSSVRGFEFTDETAIFDLFNISLVHGWILDPEEDVAASVGEMSYNQVVAKVISVLGSEAWGTAQNSMSEKPLIDLDTVTVDQNAPRLVSCHLDVTEDGIRFDIQEATASQPSVDEPSPLETPEKVDSMQVREWKAVRDWLDNHSNQLSMFGLFQLHQQLPEKELAVFFRNNHFSTIFKENKSLYILVTDQGYLAESQLVWEKLESVNNDNQFFTGDFKVFERASSTRVPDTDSDLQYALAVSMSQQNNEAPPSGIVSGDFLSLAPQSEAVQNHDADLAFAMQLQEEENMQQAYAEAQNQGQAQHRPQGPDQRVPWRGSSGHYPANYAAPDGNMSLPTSGQQAFPPPSRYGNILHDGRCQDPSAMSPEAGTASVGTNGQQAQPSFTLWKRMKRILKLE